MRSVARRIGTTAVVRALAILGLVSAPLAPAAADPFLWGVNGHPLVSYPGIAETAQIDLVADLGLRSYRVDVTDVGQADRLSRLIAVAKARGITILPVLLPPVDLKTMSPEDLYRISYGFAEVFAKRFAAEIPAWELGNEMETFAILQPCEIKDDGTTYPCAWGPAGGVGPDDYEGHRFAKVAAVLRGLSNAVHAVAPQARRAVGTAGWGHIGAFQRFRDSGVDWDISVWHVYGQDPEWGFKALAAFGKPIWVTEVNHPYGSGRDGEEAQAKGLEQQLDRIRKLAPTYDVEAVFVYELLDEAYWAPHYEAFMGLVQLEKSKTDEGWALGNRKVAYQALRRVVALSGE